ncbi:MAG: CRISPR-associated endonuclease Cas1 [Bryobacteraceae bacterium]
MTASHEQPAAVPSRLPITRDDLWLAWERVQENAGCAGADGVTTATFATRADRWIARLLERVEQDAYRAFPMLKIVVEKKPGSAETRTLLVPTVADRVLQTAVARHLSRSWEEEFLECSFAYRPGRSVDRAIARIRKCHELGYRFVVDADVHAYFDRVDHDLLLNRVASRQPGPVVLGLLRQWVRGCYWDGQKVHAVRAGIAQGSPISPLLANFFLEDFDCELEKSGRKLVRYADDFLVLAQTRPGAEEALGQTRDLLAAEHLQLNEAKTQVTDFDAGFRFLGALFLGDSVWIPWKHDRIRGRILFMARPLPLALRTRYEYAPPRGAVAQALVRAGIDAAPHRPAKTIPGGQTVAYLYLTEQGSILRKAGDRLLVEKDDEIVLDLPYHKLENVLLFGNVQVTTQALAELLEKGVHLSLFSREGTYRGSLTPPRSSNVELRLAQFQLSQDGPRALAVARAVVRGKIANMSAVLRRYRGENKVEPDFDAKLAALGEAVNATSAADGIAALDGVEGAASRQYFDLLMTFNRSELEWPGRHKHPAPDPLNALLSLTYTLLTNELAALLEGLGLESHLGFLHQIDYGRPSLALDLVECFRGPVADRFVLTMVNRRVFDASDFQSSGERPGVFLKPKPLKRYLAAFEEWVLDRPKRGEERPPSPHFRNLLRAEAEKMATVIRGGGELRPWAFDAPAEEASCNTSSVTI